MVISGTVMGGAGDVGVWFSSTAVAGTDIEIAMISAINIETVLLVGFIILRLPPGCFHGSQCEVDRVHKFSR